MTSKKRLCDVGPLIARVGVDTFKTRHDDLLVAKRELMRAHHDAMRADMPECIDCGHCKVDVEVQDDYRSASKNLKAVVRCNVSKCVIDVAALSALHSGAGILGADDAPYTSKVNIGPGSLSMNGVTIGKVTGVASLEPFNRDVLRTAFLGDKFSIEQPRGMPPWLQAPEQGSRFVDAKTGTEWEFTDGKWEAVVMKKEADKSSPKDVPGNTEVDPW